MLKSLINNESFNFKNIDWRHFELFLNKNSIGGFFFSKIQNDLCKDSIPEDVKKNCKFLYFQQWVKNQKLLKEMQDLQQVFNEKSLSAIFMKGIIFSDRFYDSTNCRTIGDIDVLVRPEELPIFHEILLKKGYERKSKILWSEKKCIHFTHHFAYRKKDIVIELHWALDNHISYRLDYGKLWETAIPWELEGTTFLAMSDEYELVMRLLGAFKDTYLGTIQIKTFIDIYMLLNKRMFDWNKFLEARKKENIHLIAINILALQLKLFPAQKEFPELWQAIDEGLLKSTPTISWQQMEIPLRFKLQNRFWGWSLYEVAFWKSASWWLIALPFHLAVFRE